MILNDKNRKFVPLSLFLFSALQKIARLGIIVGTANVVVFLFCCDFSLKL